MKFASMSLGPLGTNCYIVSSNQDTIVFDPGGDADQLIEYIQNKDLQLKAILLTHAHFDHIGAVEDLRKFSGAPVYIHELEADWLTDPELNRSAFMSDKIAGEPADYYLTPGRMNINSFQFDVVHTPGHSPGSVSFIFNKEKFVIGGDVLFNQGVGRTDLPGGSFEQLEASIRNHFYQLDDSFTVYPGHGPETTIGNEKRNNPFVTV
jgi:glyoxylase-like metal-dependent hydrolase (beta-lactamase superfamily II)